MASKEWKAYLKKTRQDIMDKFGYEKNSPQVKQPWKHFHGPVTRSKYYSSFYAGAVNGVHRKLEEKKIEAEEIHGSKITDLVLINDTEVQAWIEEAFPNSGTLNNRKKNIDGGAYNKGEDEGRNASMAKGVATGETVETKRLN